MDRGKCGGAQNRIGGNRRKKIGWKLRRKRLDFGLQDGSQRIAKRQIEMHHAAHRMVEPLPGVDQGLAQVGGAAQARGRASSL